MSQVSSEDFLAADNARSGSQRFFGPENLAFSLSSSIHSDNALSTHSSTRCDNLEALKWAALEKLPTFARLKRGILRNVSETGAIVHEEMDISKIGFAEKQKIIKRILHSIKAGNEHTIEEGNEHAIEEGNERFLLKLRERFDKVGIDRPKIEVRFEHLNIEADVYVGTRALPTLYNFTVNLLEGVSRFIGPPKKRVLKILSNMNGIIRPSRMTLLLGPPGSGKTSLLLALSGKISCDLRVSGNVTFNGHEMTEFVPQRTCAYISQHDIQFAEMTVRETLDFCGRCQGVGTRYDMLLELSRREKAAGIKPDLDIDLYMKAIAMEGQETNIVTDYVLRILGLDICADTLVGNQMRRGISGGQRKRVTTGEMLVGPAQAFFMDEISTGLDSSTTFQIVKCLQQMVHVMETTMVVSLLQPAPETFELFDDVILLSEGEVVYQGPREFILDFFKSVGYQCPERKSVADFLQEVTSRKDQAQYWVDQSQPYRYTPVKEFAEAFKSFHVGQELQLKLAVPFDKSKCHPAALSTKKYGLPAQALFKACFWRECLLMQRNSFVYIFQISIITIVTMTVFLRTQFHQDSVADANLYMGALFFGLVMVMFNGSNKIISTVTPLPVFYKERDQLLYPAWAYSIPTVIMRIPLSIIECLIWVCLTYYVIGFSPAPSRFFSQLLVLFCLSQMALGLFRFIGAVGRTMIIASSYGILS